MNQETGKPSAGKTQGKEDQSPSLQPGSLNPVETQTEEPNSSSGEKKCHYKHKTSWPVRIEAGCAVILIFITGFYTYYASQQAAAAIKAAKAAKDAARISDDTLKFNEQSVRLDQRPWIGIDKFNVVKNGDTLRFSAVIKNYGRTPALRVVDDHDMKVLPIPQGEFQTSPRFMFGTLVPGGQFDLTWERVSLEGALAHDIREGNKGVYVFGKVWYDDVWGSHHYFEFCQIMQKGGEGLNSCAHNHGTDDDQTK
jgi:hypothetical protein